MDIRRDDDDGHQVNAELDNDHNADYGFENIEDAVMWGLINCVDFFAPNNSTTEFHHVVYGRWIVMLEKLLEIFKAKLKSDFDEPIKP